MPDHKRDTYDEIAERVVTIDGDAVAVGGMRLPWTSLFEERVHVAAYLRVVAETFGLVPVGEADARPTPPQPCTGAGTVPPQYQGVTAGTASGGYAACGICGQMVGMDGHGLTVTHPYLPVATPEPDDTTREVGA